MRLLARRLLAMLGALLAAGADVRAAANNGVRPLHCAAHHGLGDSFTYGAGVAADETYLARLERALGSREGRAGSIEVVRAGVPRYFTRAERLLFEHDGEGWDPDLVLLGFVPNDVVDTAVGTEGVRVTDDVYRAGGPLETAWSEVEQELTRLASLARNRAIPLVVVHLPQRPPWTPDRSYPAERLAAWADATGVTFIDTLPALRAHARPDALYWPIDGHPRAEGHAVFAEVLAEELVRRGLVP